MSTMIHVQDELIARMIGAVGTKTFLTTLNDARLEARLKIEQLGLSHESATLATYDAIDMGYLEIACLSGALELALQRARAARRRFGDEPEWVEEQLLNEGFPASIIRRACPQTDCC